MDIQVLSTAFHQGETIPVQYTCDGNNVSPPLHWDSVPEDAQSLALVCEDPDAPAGVFVHWLIFNFPPIVSNLPEALPTTGTLVESGASQGRNDFNNIGYDGPCPPPGNLHRYYFRLYALDTRLRLPKGATKYELARDGRTHPRNRAVDGNLQTQGEPGCRLILRAYEPVINQSADRLPMKEQLKLLLFSRVPPWLITIVKRD